MAIMNVRFYAELNPDGTMNKAPMPLEPALLSEDVVVGAASDDSTAAPANATFVRVAVDVATYVEFGAAPTAAPDSMFMPAGAIEYIGIPPASAYIVACIAV